MEILAYINKITIFGIDIYFYAIIILIGALLALLLSNYHAYEKGYSFDFFNTVFLIALPSGIIGARIWYVIAEWEQFSSNFLEVFNFRGGGLAIQGGVILGALAGILVCVFRRKGQDIFSYADMAVPTILVAQAIGRYGNFFNQEVYGQIVDPSSWFLPNFIKSQMVINGYFRAPLFFLEGCINLAGYLFISRTLKVLLGKHYKYGDLTFAYFVYYGLVRLILEPVRDSTFNMGGADNMRAVTMALIFIIVGMICIVANHGIRYYLDKNKLAKR